ncbi:Flp pilus assembly protein TadD, contains TPR repeats [Aedoeadaptatus ivorii]|uniref:Flp pilus assembly protein TadD, contains TPR repeats n=1 Tax=Aedoeadaptatus ivorii TaxID=54006 RepID=A0A448V220_9FIRM|nr:hypothetical protein [Peptoniphilus ivorii]MDQ0508077.1 tetratricopeptide (TPR) repeat protein [Peptoniphilus ivorii]VEJ35808.1 Flp pilus assembly protein TadD, contains TPR repeats [Peptoniphilus ivorii]
MDTKKYFGSWYDELGFLELKDETAPLAAALSGAPIPMLEKDIVREILHPDAKDVLDAERIFTAMCIVIGLDPKFPYRDTYLAFMQRNPDEAVAAIQRRMNAALESENAELLCLLARAKEAMRGNRADMLETTYAMEALYNAYWENGEAEFAADLVKEISDRYEAMLAEKTDDAAANAGLARISEARGQYLKAKLLFEKALGGEAAEEWKDGIRKEVLRLEDPAALEAAETYLHYGKFSDALAAVEKVRSRDTDPARQEKIAGMAYYGMGAYENAILHLEEALHYGEDSAVENDLAIALAASGREEDAVMRLSALLEREPENRTALMNRGILYYRKKDYAAARIDFEAAYRLEADAALWELIQETEKNERHPDLR